MVRFIRKYRIWQTVVILLLLSSCASMPEIGLSVHFNDPGHYYYVGPASNYYYRCWGRVYSCRW